MERNKNGTSVVPTLTAVFTMKGERQDWYKCGTYIDCCVYYEGRETRLVQVWYLH